MSWLSGHRRSTCSLPRLLVKEMSGQLERQSKIVVCGLFRASCKEAGCKICRTIAAAGRSFPFRSFPLRQKRHDGAEISQRFSPRVAMSHLDFSRLLQEMMNGLMNVDVDMADQHIRLSFCSTQPTPDVRPDIMDAHSYSFAARAERYRQSDAKSENSVLTTHHRRIALRLCPIKRRLPYSNRPLLGLHGPTRATSDLLQH